MKTQRIGVHCLLLLLFLYAFAEGRQKDSTAAPHKWELIADVGKTPLFNVWDQEWKQDFILRLGVGKSVEGLGKVHLFAEYQRQHSILRWGDMNPWIMEKEYPRQSYGASLTLTLAELFVIGGVTSLVSHGDMYYHTTNYGPIDTIRNVKKGEQEVLSFLFTGLKYDIAAMEDISIPIGIYFPIPITADFEVSYILLSLIAATVRLGLLIRF